MRFGDGERLDDEGAVHFNEPRHRGPLFGAQVDQERQGPGQGGQGSLGLFALLDGKGGVDTIRGHGLSP